MRGKHTGTFHGVPATGKAISNTGLSGARAAIGKLAEQWGEQGMAGLMQQLRG